MNRGQQPQQRPPNLSQAPGLPPFNRSGVPTYPTQPGYGNVPPRSTMQQAYQSQQTHRAQQLPNMGLPPGSFMPPRPTNSYFPGPNANSVNVLSQPIISSPNQGISPMHPQQQQQQNSLQQQQQQQQQSNTSNGVPMHLTSTGTSTSTNTTATTNSNSNTTAATPNSVSTSVVDETDFPPLSSSGLNGPSAGSNPSSLPSGGNLHSSYASQAGTAIGSGVSSTSTLGPNVSQRDEDFPPLGAGNQDQPSQTAGNRQNLLVGGMHGNLMGQGITSQTSARAMSGFQTETEKRNFSKTAPTSAPWSTSQQQTQNPQPNSGFPSGLTNGLSQQQQPSSLGAPPNLPLPSAYGQGQQQSGGPIYGTNQQGTIMQVPHDSTSSSSQPQTADRWGLLGLLASIKGTDLDTQLLGSGADLSLMGLDMNSQGNLFSTFVTPWSDAAAALTVEPDFSLPACYNVSAPAPGPAKAASFSDETLFFMFYSSPRDTLQEIAAQELYNRNWRFHKEAKVWLTKESGSSQVQKGTAFERGTYTFFDPETWEKVRREATIYYEQLEERSLPPSLMGGMGMPHLSMNMNAGSGVPVGAGPQSMGMQVGGAQVQQQLRG